MPRSDDGAVQSVITTQPPRTAIGLENDTMSVNDLQKTFEAFREQCIWLRCCFNTFQDLYETDDETSELLRSTATHFFHDLNEILRDYIILQVCKLTDRAATKGHANLSVEGVNADLCRLGLMTDEIRGYTFELLRYREIVKDSRNKIIGHLDRKTILDGLPIGEHSAEEVTSFFENLQKYADEVGIGIGVGPSDFRSIRGKGDVLDLIMALKRARATDVAPDLQPGQLGVV